MAEAFLKTTSTSTVGWKQISLFGSTWHNSICLPTAEHSKKGEKLVMFWMCVWLFFRILYGHPCLGSQLGGRTIDYNHLKSNKMHPTTMPLCCYHLLSYPSLSRLDCTCNSPTGRPQSLGFDALPHKQSRPTSAGRNLQRTMHYNV